MCEPVGMNQSVDKCGNFIIVCIIMVFMSSNYLRIQGDRYSGITEQPLPPPIEQLHVLSQELNC